MALRKSWPLVTFIIVSIGCSEMQPQPSGGSSAKVIYLPLVKVDPKTENVVSATVYVGLHDKTPIAIPFAGQREARQLEDLFKGLRAGTRSPMSGAWIETASVDFHYDDGSVVSITTDFEEWSDSEGRSSGVSKDAGRLVASMLPDLEPKIRDRVLYKLGVESISK